MSSLAAQVARLPDLSVEELAAQYRELFGVEPPIRRHTWLWRRVAWRLQVDEHGDLAPEARARLLQLAERYPDPPSDGVRRSTPVPGIRRKGRLTPGTVLERDYKGRTIRATVLESGIEHEGVVYPSLSAVARAVTGSAWNGRLFFGLTKRSRGS